MIFLRAIFFGIVLAVVVYGAPAVFFALVPEYETFGSSTISLIIEIIAWALLAVGTSAVQVSGIKKDCVLPEVALTLISSLIFYYTSFQLAIAYFGSAYPDNQTLRGITEALGWNLFIIIPIIFPFYVIISVIIYNTIFRKNKQKITKQEISSK